MHKLAEYAVRAGDLSAFFGVFVKLNPDTRRIRDPGLVAFVSAQFLDTLAFTLKTPWSDGTTHLLLSPLELIEKLAALVPPPRQNLVRYHGVLAPNAAGRAHIVPGPCEDGGDDATEAPTSDEAQEQPAQPAYRLSWARLLTRVFLIDVTVCPHCGGKMKIIAALTEPAAIRAYLD